MPPGQPRLIAGPWASVVSAGAAKPGETEEKIAEWTGVGTVTSIAITVGPSANTPQTAAAWYVGFALRVSVGGVPLTANLLAPLFTLTSIPNGQPYFYPGPEINLLAGNSDPGTAPVASTKASVQTYTFSGAYSADASDVVRVTFLITQTFTFAGSIALYMFYAGSTLTIPIPVQGRLNGTKEVLLAV